VKRQRDKGEQHMQTKHGDQPRDHLQRRLRNQLYASERCRSKESLAGGAGWRARELVPVMSKYKEGPEHCALREPVQGPHKPSVKVSGSGCQPEHNCHISG